MLYQSYGHVLSFPWWISTLGTLDLVLCPAASLNALDGDIAAAIGVYQSLVVFDAQGSTSVLSPYKSFPSPGETFWKHLAQQCHLSQSCRDCLGFSTPGIKSLMIEYLSLGKLFLARAVWNQFIVYRGKHLKKGHSSHHCESRALKFIHIKDTMTAFHPTVTSHKHGDSSISIPHFFILSQDIQLVLSCAVLLGRVRLTRPHGL